jgi:hypothetical protein
VSSAFLFLVLAAGVVAVAGELLPFDFAAVLRPKQCRAPLTVSFRWPLLPSDPFDADERAFAHIELVDPTSFVD